ncbi:pullulanase X25 domain-containing protein [Ruminococcus difficilis]|uniref:Amylopullulanase X25 domain-containing protein n=1 Tax=Ruminococcus difficilis TaxID=2763069 RepID=A0A934WQ85_9FIRM|nr:hypothetical protein [Ruminococcus difficilis]MBK6087128.1 hypothetical protein [Ruminococcus difficilis]
MKQKTNRLHFSTRTLAMVLSIVMLIGSIATGSMLNTFAAYLKDAAANSDAVSQAATEGGNIALNAIPSQDADAANITDNNDAKDAPDLSGFEENEIVRSMKDDLADTGAKTDLASTGDWDTLGKNSIYMKGPGESSFSMYAKTDSSGKMTFTLNSSGYYEWYLQADYGGSKTFRLKGGDAQPSGAMGDTTNYYAKLSTGQGGTGGENYYIYFSAGEYTIQYNGNWDSGKQIEYTFTRKLVQIFGDLTGSWSNTKKDMSYDSSSKNYYYEVTGDNDRYYKFKVDSSDHYSWENNFDLVGNGFDGSTDAKKYSATTDSDKSGNAFKVKQDAAVIYRIWVKDNKTWVTSTAVSTDIYTVVGAMGATDQADPGIFGEGNSWKVDASSNDLVYKSDGTYEKTYTVTAADAGTIYFKVAKDHAWTEAWPSANQTFKINSDSTWVKFSFNPTTHEITVTQDGNGTGGGGSTSSDWIAGDKYTSTGKQNSSQKVANTPIIGSNTSTYKFVWADNDNGPGKSGTTPVSTVANGTSGNIGYWADLTSTIKGNGDGNFFFALSNNDSNSGIRGNKSEQINCVTKSAGTSVDIHDSQGNTVFVVEMKERSETSGNAHFILLRGFKWEKITNIGVMAYYNNSSVDYQFYFKEPGSSEDEETVEKVNIYAKNGALRDNTFNRFTNLADTQILGDASNYAETDVFSYTEATASGVTTYSTIAAYNTAHPNDQIVITHNVAGPNGISDYDKMTNVPVGAKIKIQTTLSDNASAAGSFDSKAFKVTHYLKAYTFNGVTYQVHDYDASGVYTEEWTVESVNTAKMKTENGHKAIEVTPIYYLADTSNVKTFYIDGYDGSVHGQWGNMLSVYPYYEGKSNSANAFGGYPGQPMLKWGGKYQMQIPLTSDGTASGAQVKGVTLHNAYWDLLHRELDTQCNSSSHCQTYDYDDFYKLNKEKNPDTIIFDFKYRTTKDNYGDGFDYTNYTFASSESTAQASTYTGSGYNGVELLTDYFGRQVDVFGTLINDSDKSDWHDADAANSISENHVQDKELLIVSTGYKDTYVGEYATMWAVYAPSAGYTKNGDAANSFIGYISPSMLYLNKIDRVNQYTGGTQTSSGRMSWGDSTNKGSVYTYNYLKEHYTGVPALISYEEEIWNDSKDKANRSDGRWYYSNKDDKISANIKIQYGPASNLNATVDAGNWTDDPFSTTAGVGGEQNIGTSTLCSAYFTNTSPSLYGKTESGEQFADSSKKFTFEAQANGAYMFAGWVRYSNGKYYDISAKEIAESDMSSNDTYIARFVEAVSGSLSIQHVVEKTGSYTGDGTPSVTVTVKNGSTTVFTDTKADGSKIDISKYINTKYRNYTIDIRLSTTPDEDCTLEEITSSVGNFSAGTITNNTATVGQFTVQQVLDSGATTLRYVSHLTRTAITYNYNITYTYESRFWGNQTYSLSGTLVSTNDTQMAGIVKGTKKGTARLTTEFLYNHTPYEKNFRQKIAWNHAEANQSVTGSGTTYTITANVGSTNTVDDRVTAEFMLPYKYDTKANGYSALAIDKYASAESTTASGTEIVFDDKSYESAPITTQAYKLFTYDGTSAIGGSDSHASYMPLVEAAPYVVKNATVHRNMTYKKRYLNAGVVTENDTNYYYFTYNSIRYFYKNLPPTHLDSDRALTENDKVTYYKTDDNGDNISYTYSYALNLSGTTYADNEDGNATRPAVYYWDFGTGEKGQYCVTHEHYEDDGIITGTGDKKYFTRWDIYNSSGDYVASTYYKKFNYTGYENYTVIPIYESDSETVAQDSDKNANKVPTINFLGDTRNQWNNNGGGTNSARQGDKLMTDFAISFDYYEDEIAKIKNRTQDSENGKDIRIGMLIEQMGELDTAGGKKITDPSYYADKYKSSYTAATISSIETALSTNSKPTGTGANAIVNSKIAANVSGWGRLFTDTTGDIGNNHTGLAPIDNYNRLQWYYTFNNIFTSNGNPTNDKNYVYRASAYLIETTASDTKVTLSTTPVYFTLYDLANRQLGELD